MDDGGGVVIMIRKFGFGYKFMKRIMVMITIRRINKLVC